MVLALPKAAEMRRGSEVAEGRGGTLEKEKEEGLPVIVPILDFSG